jgi:hypothetical protein
MARRWIRTRISISVRLAAATGEGQPTSGKIRESSYILPPMSGTIDIHLADPGWLAFKTRARCRVLLDDEEVGALRIGDTAGFSAPAGAHELRIAMEVGPISRKTKRLQLFVVNNETVRVTGRYSRLWGKYIISLSP